MSDRTTRCQRFIDSLGNLKVISSFAENKADMEDQLYTSILLSNCSLCTDQMVIIVMSTFSYNKWNRFKFLTLTRKFQLEPGIQEPTRINSCTETCIDNIFTNMHVTQVEVIPTNISDHTCQKITMTLTSSSKIKSVYIRQISDTAEE
ncbi:hypothetical protein WA026_008413 [Henosepilachna vigintioctopunctata]|uniref:Uncharacterized protein n=1 Tax=Henosepilachna vigintioctopunctata TaxID=420089 RepID=A0AAW1U875_9CUCU